METLHALPKAGGLLDQPAGLMRRVSVALNIFHGLRLYWRTPADQFDQQRHPGAYSTWQLVTTLRMEPTDE